MADIVLTQNEAEALLQMEKFKADNTPHNFPLQGESLSVELLSADKRERFVLDIQRGRIKLAKVTYQNRAHRTVVLARLDLAGPPHRNPDGQEMPCPHLHLYREGFGDKWAIPIDPQVFRNPDDLWTTYQEFLAFCKVVDSPNIQRGLFI